MTVRLAMYQPEHDYRSPACAPCAGKCCKSMPGATHPVQWGATPEEMTANLAAAFATGRWSIDWWEGDPREDIEWDDDRRVSRAEYVRPAMRGFENRHDVDHRHPAWGREGPCIFLGADGCTTPHDERPVECRALKPQTDGIRCESQGSGKQQIAVAWLPFQQVIREALRASRGAL